MLKRKCKNCFIAFEVFSSLQKKKNRGIFCSKSCATQYRNKINNPMKNTNSREKCSNSLKGRIPWNKGIKNCWSKEVLDKIKEKRKFQICSPETRLKMSEGRKGNKHWNWKGGISKNSICKKCGKNISYGHRYCKKCSVKISIREKSPNWKGGLTSEKMRIAKSEKYKEWRQRVFIRDDFTCQKCGKRGGKLHAHHKNLFSKMLEEIKGNLPLLNLYAGAMIYTPLWNTANGITLCKKCHYKIKHF